MKEGSGEEKEREESKEGSGNEKKEGSEEKKAKSKCC
jgi:hypothetical protein